MTMRFCATLAVVGLGMAGATTASADIEYDQYVTPDTIFGSGNTNGHFTTDRRNGVEIGLRAKIPFTGTLNSNGDGTYSYTLLETDHDSNAATANRWNFDWTVNTDYNGFSGLVLSDLTYELGMDADPGLGVDYLVFDPITPTVTTPYFDHSIGDNSTANGGGVEAGDELTYETLLDANNVLQQSWRYSFFPVAPLDAYDPDVDGTYAIYLLARNFGGEIVARSDIQVLIGDAEPVGPTLFCEGFVAPMDQDVLVKKMNRVLPLRMVLLDGFGVPMTGDDIDANPIVQVTYAGVYDGDADLADVDSAGSGDDGNQFVYGDEYWAFNMKTKDLSPGVYTVSVLSGDLLEYNVDQGCEVSVTIQ